MRLPWLPLTVSMCLVACDSRPPETAPLLPPRDAIVLPEADPALDTATREAWHQGGRWLADTRDCAADLHQRIEAFLDTPEDSALTRARAYWSQCHHLWQYNTLLLTLGDSSPGLFGELEHHTFNIAAPVQMPGYIDALEDYPYSGVVMDTTVAISASALRQQHGLTDDTDVILGFYALEFLLTGEGGQRSSAYQVQEELDEQARQQGLSVVNLPNNRRRELLRLVSHLLQDDLQALHSQWQNDEGPLKLPYMSLPGESRLQLLHNAARKMLATLYDESPDQVSMTAALEGMQQLLTRGDPALARWLEPPDWQDTLETLLRTLSLAEVPEDEDSGDQEQDGNIDALLLQLIEQF